MMWRQQQGVSREPCLPTKGKGPGAGEHLWLPEAGPPDKGRLQKSWLSWSLSRRRMKQEKDIEY